MKRIYLGFADSRAVSKDALTAAFGEEYTASLRSAGSLLGASLLADMSEDGAADARCAHRKRQAVLQTLFPDIIFDISRRRRCRMCAFIRRRCGDRY